MEFEGSCTVFMAEFFRGLYVVQEDLWQQVFPVGTEVKTCLIYWICGSYISLSCCFDYVMLNVFLYVLFDCQWDQLDMVYQYDWNFSNLEVSCPFLIILTIQPMKLFDNLFVFRLYSGYSIVLAKQYLWWEKLKSCAIIVLTLTLAGCIWRRWRVI